MKATGLTNILATAALAGGLALAAAPSASAGTKATWSARPGATAS